MNTGHGPRRTPARRLVWWCAALLAAPLCDSRAAEVGRWTTGTPAPTARTEVAAAAVDGAVYVVGGIEPPGLRLLGRAVVSDKVEVYDPAADAWSVKPALPVGLHHAGAAALDGALYIVGGFTQSGRTFWEPSNRVFRFDADRNAWEERAPLPTARGGLAVTAMQGNIVAVGGYDGRRNPPAVEVYDAERNRWDAAAPLPTPRDHLAVVAAGDMLYAIGGRVRGDYRQNLSTVEVYDAARDRWVAAAGLPTPRSGIAACVIGGNIHVVGGESDAGTFSHNERYDPHTRQWETMAPMPTARHGLGAAAVDGKMYVMSGGPQPGGSYSRLNEIFIPSTRSRPAGRAPASHVGSVMAVLSVMDEAGVLPPESGAEANQLIHAMIQSQSAFLKSPSPALRAWWSSALTDAFGAKRAAALTAEFASAGWTSETLEALVDASARQPRHAEPPWAAALLDYNVTAADWALIDRVFTEARERLHLQGRNVHEVFAAHRDAMPGAR